MSAIPGTASGSSSTSRSSAAAVRSVRPGGHICAARAASLSAGNGRAAMPSGLPCPSAACCRCRMMCRTDLLPSYSTPSAPRPTVFNSPGESSRGVRRSCWAPARSGSAPSLCWPGSASPATCTSRRPAAWPRSGVPRAPCPNGLASRVLGVDRSFFAPAPSGFAGTPRLHPSRDNGLTAVANLDMLHGHDLLAAGPQPLERHQALLKGRHHARRRSG